MPHNWINLLWLCLIQSKYWELLGNLIMYKGCILELIFLPVPNCFILTNLNEWLWYAGTQEAFWFQLRWQDRWQLVSGNSPFFLQHLPDYKGWGCVNPSWRPFFGPEDTLQAQPPLPILLETWWAQEPDRCERWTLTADLLCWFCGYEQ